jgi:hypothetical protein
MDDATGEAAGMGLRVAFDRRLKLNSTALASPPTPGRSRSENSTTRSASRRWRPRCSPTPHRAQRSPQLHRSDTRRVQAGDSAAHGCSCTPGSQSPDGPADARRPGTRAAAVQVWRERP